MNNFWKDLKKPFLALAPMEGATDYVFREIISEIAKPDVLFTEFTNARSLFSRGHEETLRRLKFSRNQSPIVAQIWGVNPESYYKAGKLIEDQKFDGIDINMGCPDKSIMKKGAGSALISSPALAEELIKALKDGAKNIPISVKTRIGIDSMVTDEWISFLLKQNIQALTVHGRIAKHMSGVPADWDEIHKCVKLRDQIAPETVIIGNGDVLTHKEAIEKSSKYGVDGVMIGRGVFQNPYVFDRSEALHSHAELLELLLKHARLYVDTWGDTKNFNELRRFFKIYVKGFKGANKVKVQLMETKNLEDVENIILPLIKKLKNK